MTIALGGLLSACGFDAGSDVGATVQTVALASPTLRPRPAALPLQERVSDSPGLARELSGAFRDAANEVLPAVVRVEAQQAGRGGRAGGIARGSGFVLDEAGHVITNNHVVARATRVLVRFVNGRSYEAEVVGSDQDTDVAVLELKLAAGEQVPAARIGADAPVEVGDWVLALGSPLDLDFTVTAGIVSAKGRQLSIGTEGRQTALESYIQTDAAINPGNSGGPLVDLDGRVVGVNTAIQSPNRRFIGYGFAIPMAIVSRVADDLLEYGVVHRPRLGVSVRDVLDPDAEAYGLDRIEGAWIESVQEGLPAARSGLRHGDVVLAIDGAEVANANELTTQLLQRQPGQRIRLSVRRFQEDREVIVRLDEFEPRKRARTPPTLVAETPTDRVGFSVEAVRSGTGSGTRLVIEDIADGGPVGERARGWEVVSINGVEIGTVRDFRRLASRLEGGDLVSLILTDGEDERIVNYRARP
ncbi:MAG: trypsin-like peptidase domain-containing protein [Gemmatimonadota bacterium]